MPNGPPREYVGLRGGGYGGDDAVPEFKTQEYCDPFAVDVFRLGNFIRENFTEVRFVLSILLCGLLDVALDSLRTRL